MISIVLYGDAKVGKTWLASTAPKPVLFLDAEAGGMRHVPGTHSKWDISTAPPTELPDDAVCSADIESFSDLKTAVQWLAAKPFAFKSIVLDSLTEAQSRLVRHVSPGRQPKIADWGAIGRELDDLVVTLRDIMPARGIDCLVFVCGVEDDGYGKVMPMLQGRMRRILPYKVDIVGCLRVRADESGKSRRLLQITPDDMTVAGKRDGGVLPDWLWDPDLSDLYNTVNGE